jgi:hypothetical protein
LVVAGAWDERTRGEEIARVKVPPVKGLSAETMAAIEAGELEIASDDDQSQMLARLAEDGVWREQGPSTNS